MCDLLVHRFVCLGMYVYMWVNMHEGAGTCGDNGLISPYLRQDFSVNL